MPAVAVALADARDDVTPVHGADLAKRADGRPVIGILGGALRFGLVAEHVPARRQLGEHDEVRTLLGGRGRPEHGL